jgi:hypothetical protein
MTRSTRPYHGTWMLRNLYKDKKRCMVVKKPGIKFPYLLCIPSVGEDRTVDFLGENKMTGGRLWASRFFWCHRVVESWAHRSVFLGSPNKSGCSTWMISGPGPH